MGEHAKLSASGSKKWLNCPMSLTLEGYFENEESTYAREGTIAHSLGELKIKRALKQITLAEYSQSKMELLNGLDALAIGELEKYTDDYADYVQERYNCALGSCHISDILIEHKLDYSEYAPGGYGTGDIVICDFENIEIIDLKYGKGVRVDAYKNTQLMLYGLGALGIYDDLFDIKKVRLTVYQPRIDNISSYDISADELVQWGETVVVDKANMANNGEGECSYGSHCDDGFCRARPLCKTYSERHIKIAEYVGQHPRLMSEEELVNAYDIAVSYEKWVRILKTYIQNEMLKGKKLPGLKLVEGRSNRVLKNEPKVISILEKNGFKKEDIIVEKMLSLTDLEKLMGRAKFDELLSEYIIKPQGSPTVVSAEDKRPEYNSAENDFKNINID